METGHKACAWPSRICDHNYGHNQTPADRAACDQNPMGTILPGPGHRGVTTPPRPSPARGAIRHLSSGVRDMRPTASLPAPQPGAFGSLQPRQGAVSSPSAVGRTYPLTRLPFRLKQPHSPIQQPPVPTHHAGTWTIRIGHTWWPSRTPICDHLTLVTDPARRRAASVTN